MISIFQLRETLVNSLSPELTLKGYKVNSKNTSFVKSADKANRIEINIDCYDYKPTRIEFRLLFIFKLRELLLETKSFYKFLGREYQTSISFILSEGHFFENIKSESNLIKNAYTHKITDQTSLANEVNQCKTHLITTILPFLEKFCLLSSFQEYIIEAKDEIIRFNLIDASLIAAKLHSQEALLSITSFLWNLYDLDKKPAEFELKFKIIKLLEYSKAKYPSL